MGSLVAVVLVVAVPQGVQHVRLSRSAMRALESGSKASMEQFQYLVESGALLGRTRQEIEPLSDSWASTQPSHHFATLGMKRSGILPFGTWVIALIEYDEADRCKKATLLYD